MGNSNGGWLTKRCNNKETKQEAQLPQREKEHLTSLHRTVQRHFDMLNRKHTHWNKNKYTEMYDIITYCVLVCKIIISCLVNRRSSGSINSQSQTLQRCIAESQQCGTLRIFLNGSVTFRRFQVEGDHPQPPLLDSNKKLCYHKQTVWMHSTEISAT